MAAPRGPVPGAGQCVDTALGARAGWSAVTALILHTSFDAIGAYAQSVFWGRVLGFAGDPDHPEAPGDEECLIVSPDGSQRLLFIEVPEPKQVKNRLHLHLVPPPAPGMRSSPACASLAPAR